MSNINILQFQEDRQPREWRKLYHFARKRSVTIISLKWALTELANNLKIVFEQKFLWSFVDFFCFYIRNSLEKQDENSGVLLNCLWDLWFYLRDLLFCPARSFLILSWRSLILSDRKSLILSRGNLWLLRKSLILFRQSLDFFPRLLAPLHPHNWVFWTYLYYFRMSAN